MNALLYMPGSARPFFRFVVGRREDDIVRLQGPFRFQDRDERAGVSEQRAALKEAYAWFNGHVKVPPRSVFAEPHGTACWFRNDAGEALARIRKLVKLLVTSGHSVRFIASDRPGTIVYYDEHQVVTRRPLPGRRRDCYWELPIANGE
jgi:hypothetical protein